jgi:hypothetical protein
LDLIAEDRRAEFIETDPARRHQLAALKERIRRLGYPLFDGYPAVSPSLKL